MKLDSASGAMTWNTFLGAGSGGMDYGQGVARDSSGNVYVAGYSNGAWASPLSIFDAGYDAWVSKLDSGGSLSWMTFVGGGGNDYGYGVAVDGSDDVYVVGDSSASWGASPVRAYTGGQDGFIAKLDGSGALQWNTFLGDSGDDYGRAIAVDGSAIYATGYSTATWGSPLSGYSYTAGADAYLAKLDTSSGALSWHIFLGGSGDDYGRDVAANSSNAYVTGDSDATWGASPVQGYTAGSDAFAASVSNAGALSWHTFLGGSGDDYGRGITVGSTGNVYVVGDSTATWGASPVNGYTAGSDAFAAKLDNAGALVWHTFVGGSGDDYGRDVASEYLVIVGDSTADWGSPDRAYTANSDIYAAELNPTTGSLSWSTFLGGDGDEYGRAIESGSVYVVGDGNTSWESPVRGC